MYIKRYSIAALLLIFMLGWFVYGFVSKESIHIELLGIMLPSLPVAVWVALAMLLLYAGTLAHMLFYSVVGSVRLRKYEKDYAHLLDAVADAFLQKEDRRHAFKTERYALMGEIADHSRMLPDENLEGIEHPKLGAIIQAIQLIEKGESADLKRFNLPSGNPLVRQNHINQLAEGKLDAETVLSKPERYDAAIHALAFEQLSVFAPLHILEKYRPYMTFKAALSIVNRINAEENTLSVPNATVVDFVTRIEGLSSLDYLYLGVVMGEHMLPEQRIAVFEMLSDNDDKALDGYLFTLFDLEMVDRAKELLHITAENEYVLFKAYADLKACNKHYDVKRFANMMLQNYSPKA
ncbi:hypothetical protein LOH54_05690 [Sulfurimonas sp. HSL-3221]|uniref:hypothetical protein n=1 Tax=Sulfurimonadaceae TaxID=2771471 RepID=UPI001E2F8D9C|nr:hypothetical protein [Sulfurimonas sp. HSL-3221]UFS63624.1 hypothetical protein LOH54_05690 [Sulfurimonas sp. HSL-3221]